MNENNISITDILFREKDPTKIRKGIGSFLTEMERELFGEDPDFLVSESLAYLGIYSTTPFEFEAFQESAQLDRKTATAILEYGIRIGLVNRVPESNLFSTTKESKELLLKLCTED